MSYRSLIHNASQDECVAPGSNPGSAKEEKKHAGAGCERGDRTNEIANVCVCLRVRGIERKRVCGRERVHPCGFCVFFAGHRRSTVDDMPSRATDKPSRGGRPVLDSPSPRPPRNRWRATPSIPRYPPQPGGRVARGVRKNGVTYARSWRYIPLYAKSRGTPAISRYGR